MRAMVALRWVAALPASLIAGWIAWFLVLHLNRLSMRWNDINPDGLLARGFVEFVSHFLYGCVFVLAGAIVAPRHQKKVAYVLAVIVFILAGFLLFYAVFTRDYWMIWGLLGLVVGTGFIAYKISVDDIQVEEPDDYVPDLAPDFGLIPEPRVVPESKETTRGTPE